MNFPRLFVLNPLSISLHAPPPNRPDQVEQDGRGEEEEAGRENGKRVCFGPNIWLPSPITYPLPYPIPFFVDFFLCY